MGCARSSAGTPSIDRSSPSESACLTQTHPGGTAAPINPQLLQERTKERRCSRLNQRRWLEVAAAALPFPCPLACGDIFSYTLPLNMACSASGTGRKFVRKSSARSQARSESRFPTALRAQSMSGNVLAYRHTQTQVHNANAGGQGGLYDHS